MVLDLLPGQYGRGREKVLVLAQVQTRRKLLDSPWPILYGEASHRLVSTWGRRPGNNRLKPWSVPYIDMPLYYIGFDGDWP